MFWMLVENSAGVCSSLLIRVPALNKLWQMLCENSLSKLKLDPRISLYCTKLLTTAMAHRSLKYQQCGPPWKKFGDPCSRYVAKCKRIQVFFINFVFIREFIIIGGIAAIVSLISEPSKYSTSSSTFAKAF